MCRNATVVYVHMQQAWCKCWAVARPPVVPGGFCFTMSQLVEDSIAHMEDSLNTGRCILSEGLLVDPVGWAPGYGKEGFESYVIKTQKCHLRIQKGQLWSELEKLLWPWCIFCFCLCTSICAHSTLYSIYEKNRYMHADLPLLFHMPRRFLFPSVSYIFWTYAQLHRWPTYIHSSFPVKLYHMSYKETTVLSSPSMTSSGLCGTAQ